MKSIKRKTSLMARAEQGFDLSIYFLFFCSGDGVEDIKYRAVFLTGDQRIVPVCYMIFHNFRCKNM